MSPCSGSGFTRTLFKGFLQVTGIVCCNSRQTLFLNLPLLEGVFHHFSDILCGLVLWKRHCLKALGLKWPIGGYIVNCKAHKGFTSTTGTGPQVCSCIKPQTLCQLLLHTGSYLLAPCTCLGFGLWRSRFLLWHCLFH